jgi:hypothetical protein
MLGKSILPLGNKIRYIIPNDDPVCGRGEVLMKPVRTFASQGKPAVSGPNGSKSFSLPQNLPDTPGPGQDKLTITRKQVLSCPLPELVISNYPYPPQHIVS